MNSTFDSFPERKSETTSESVNVLVYDDEYGWVVGFYCYEDLLWFSVPDGEEIGIPTHWIDLPEPPK